MLDHALCDRGFAHRTKMLSRTLRKVEEKTKSMDESRDQCTVVFAQIVTETAGGKGYSRPLPHTQTHTSH
jgi:hypothetical protein